MGSVASAFITTMAQLPGRRSHRSSWVPAPVAEAAQKVCAPGRAGVLVPGTSRYSTLKGRSSSSLISDRLTPSRYRATSCCSATPMKMSLPAVADAPRRRMLPAVSDGMTSGRRWPTMMSSPTDVMALELASKRSVDDVKKPSSRCWMLSHPVPAAAATSPRPSKAESVPRTSITMRPGFIPSPAS